MPLDHHPRLVEAEQRLRHLRRHGPTAYAFPAALPFGPGLAAPVEG